MKIKKDMEFPLYLAPMAGITHRAFRELVARFGGCTLFYTEMLNSRIVSTQNIMSEPYCLPGDNDRPLIAQVVGSEPDKVISSFLRLNETGIFNGFDFNLGCSRATIIRHGWGSALMSNPLLVKEIIREARRVIKSPLSLKIRYPSPSSPWDIKKWAEYFDTSGIDAVIIHARLPEELFRRPAKWERIKELKSMVSIPVIGNGDIFSPEDAQKMMETTGCDGIMIGRSAIMRPWIFRDIVSYIEKGTVLKPPNPVDVIDEFLNLLTRYLPQKMWKSRFINFATWFCQNFKFGLHYLRKSLKEKEFPQMAYRMMEELKGETIPPYPCQAGLINV